MRPHGLRVTAFGAFAGTERVAFDELDGLFLLHGETGAGKTTLLDAIAFALYGRVPGERGGARRLRSDHAARTAATEVELEVTIGGRRLRVTRRPEQHRPKKSGHGFTTEPASVRLEERPAAGDWEVKSTRIGEADKEIAELLGMSAEQFFQVVLLPQGEFARFLRAEAKDKEALLQRLFGTDRFRQAEDWLADRRRATDKEVDAAEGTVTLLVAQLAQAAGTEVPEVPDAPAAWAADLYAAVEADRAAAAVLAAVRKADFEVTLAARTQAEQLAGRQRRRQDALSRQRELQAATPEVARLGADAAGLRAAGQEQQTQVGRLEGLRAVAREAKAEDAATAAARARAAELAAELEQAEGIIRQRQGDRPAAERARDAAREAATAVGAAQAEADTARRAARDAGALVQEHGRWARLYEALQSAREKANDAQSEALRIRLARIDGMRAELAATMTDDSPCPVCGSLDHPDPVDAESFPPVSRDEEAAAVELAATVAQAAEQAGREVAAADAKLGDLVQRLTDAGVPLPLAETGSLTMAGSLAATAAATAEEAARLEAAAAGLSEAAGALPARQRALDELDQAIADDRTRLTDLAGQRTATLDAAGAAAARAAERRASLRAQLGDEDDLEAAIGAATHLAGALTSAAAVADQLADPDLDVELAPPAPVAETTAATAAAQQAHDEANTAYGTAEHRTAQLAQLAPRLDRALAARRPLRERADQVRQLADLANGTSGANQYKMTLSSFVLAARLEEVAAAASERLLTMTAGRYSLVHSDARRGNAKAGLSLLACDAWTGVDRDTATLSGGETFLASLALALGLADTVTAESAGTPMEALFVDEGFGTLDEETLDEVMNVLDGLRAGGRVVGIVSHVAELRQRIPTRVHVRKTRTGSHVEVTAG